jgi:hypothetical protein
MTLCYTFNKIDFWFNGKNWFQIVHNDSDALIFKYLATTGESKVLIHVSNREELFLDIECFYSKITLMKNVEEFV